MFSFFKRDTKYIEREEREKKKEALDEESSDPDRNLGKHRAVVHWLRVHLPYIVLRQPCAVSPSPSGYLSLGITWSVLVTCSTFPPPTVHSEVAKGSLNLSQIVLVVCQILLWIVLLRNENHLKQLGIL